MHSTLRRLTKSELLRMGETHTFLFLDENGYTELQEAKESTAWECTRRLVGALWEREKDFWNGYGSSLCKMDDGAGGLCEVRLATLTELRQLGKYIDSFRDREGWSQAAWAGLGAEDTDIGFRIWRIFHAKGEDWELKSIKSTITWDYEEDVQKFARSELYEVLPFEDYDRYASRPDTNWIDIFNETFEDRKIEEDPE